MTQQLHVGAYNPGRVQLKFKTEEQMEAEKKQKEREMKTQTDYTPEEKFERGVQIGYLGCSFNKAGSEGKPFEDTLNKLREEGWEFSDEEIQYFSNTWIHSNGILI